MCITTLAILFCCTFNVLAGDWPQGLGPHRTGIADNEQDLKAWSSTGPKKLWSHELGMGFAGPVVSGNLVVIFHRVDGSERLALVSNSQLAGLPDLCAHTCGQFWRVQSVLPQLGCTAATFEG